MSKKREDFLTREIEMLMDDKRDRTTIDLDVDFSSVDENEQTNELIKIQKDILREKEQLEEEIALEFMKAEEEYNKTVNENSSSVKTMQTKIVPYEVEQDTSELSIKKQKKQNYQKLSLKEVSPKELWRSFHVQFSYTFRKLVFSKKKIWVISFFTAVMFFFLWRNQTTGIGEQFNISSYLVLMVFSVFALLILPIITSYYVSRAYRDERDNGDLLFIVTKKDHKANIYFAKYVAACSVSLLWILFYFLSAESWILIKHLIAMPMDDNLFMTIVGDNPPISQLGEVMKVGLTIVSASALIILFWGSIFFMVSRIMPSRGIVLSSMMAPLMAILFPIIGNIITGFTSVSGISAGTYEIFEYDEAKPNSSSSTSPTNTKYYCKITTDYQGSSRWNVNDPSEFYQYTPSVQIDWDDRNISNQPYYLRDNFSSSLTEFSVNGLRDACENHSTWLRSSDSDQVTGTPELIKYDSPDNPTISPSSWTTSYSTKRVTRGYTTNQSIISGAWDRTTVDSFENVQRNNSVGWLSFLNPIYYSSILIEQPMRMVFPDGELGDTMFNSSKILSSMFGGKHNAKMTELSDSAAYEHMRNKEFLGIGNTNWNNSTDFYRSRYSIPGLNSSSVPSNNNVYYNGTPVDFGGTVEGYIMSGFSSVDSEDPDNISRSSYLPIPYLKIHNAGLYDYNGLEYWLNPGWSILLLSLTGILFTWIAVRSNSRYDLSRL